MVALLFPAKGKFADFDFVTLSACLRLGQTDAADTRFGIRCGRDSIPVNRQSFFARHLGHRNHALRGGDMSELRHTRDYISDRVDARFIGLHELVGLDETAFQLNFRVLESYAGGVWGAAHGNEQLLGFSRFDGAVRQRNRHGDAVRGSVDVVALGAGLDADSLLLEHAGEFFGDLFVFNGNRARKHLEDLHFRAELAEHGCELDADSTRADHVQRLRNAFELQDFDVGEDRIVRFQAGKHPRFRTGRDQDVLRLHDVGTLAGNDLDPAAALQCGRAADDLDLVLLHQEIDTLGMFGNDSVFALHHFREVQRWIFHADALGLRMFHVRPDFSRVKQAFGRDAADEEAGAPQPVLFLNERGLESVLAGANGCGVAPGATPDNYEVIRHKPSLYEQRVSRRAVGYLRTRIAEIEAKYRVVTVPPVLAHAASPNCGCCRVGFPQQS